MKELPIKIEAVIFKNTNEGYRYLCLKRTEADGGWWQPVTGGVYADESIETALRRELKEETGIELIKNYIHDVYHFHWEWENEMYLEFVSGVEVYPDTLILLNAEEHEQCKWCNYEEAYALFKYPNNRHSLQMLNAIVTA